LLSGLLSNGWFLTPMDSYILLGLFAGLLTTIGFLPQIVKGFKSKRMDDVSLFMPILLGAGMALWLGYGLVLNDLPIILWNAAGLALNLIIVVLKIRYKGSRTLPV